MDRHYTVDISDEDGLTPAHGAALLGNMDAINLLLENGADLKYQNRLGETVFDSILKIDDEIMFSIFY